MHFENAELSFSWLAMVTFTRYMAVLRLGL